MWINYIKSTFRNLRKQRLNAIINLTGLSIGLACCLLIALYINHELQYDQYHEKSDRIWRVTRDFLSPDGGVYLQLSAIAPPFAPLIKEEFAEVEEIARLLNFGTNVRKGEDLYTEKNLFLAEASIFDIFSIDLLSGDPETALEAPLNIMLSESAARRYFGTENPLDKELRVGNLVNMRVSGVYKDFPKTSHFHPELLASFNLLRDSTIYGEERLRTSFSNNAFYTYMLVTPNFNAENMAARFPAFLDKTVPSGETKASVWTQLHLQKLTDIHLYSHRDDEIEPNGNISTLRMFGIIAIVILLIACMNYINLSTAFSLKRAKEIGVRKSAGAHRGQLIAQFLIESVVITVVASLLAAGIAFGVLPFLNKAFGIDIVPSLLSVWYFPIVLLGVSILTGLLAGLYPALFLSSFQPVQVLKSSANLKIGGGGIFLRKGLVVAQFSISIVLLIGTIIISQQLHYLRNKELGLDQEQVITVSGNTELNERWEAFSTELTASPFIKNIARSSRLPSTRMLDNMGDLSAQVSDSLAPSKVNLQLLSIDHSFIPTYNIPMVAGRNFLLGNPTDSLEGIILNEKAALAIGWKTPEDAVGKRINYGDRTNARVVGVVKDFHFESLHQDIIPMIFLLPARGNNLRQISIKVEGDVTAALAHLEQTWEQFSPNFPFAYSFLSEQYGQLYEAEQRQGELFSTFSGLAIFIACLGLFGLVTFSIQRRVKEIGIRKVLGASVPSIVGLLSKDFLQLVLLALIVASPLAWYLMKQWLENFAYRINIHWWVFVLAGVGALLIAFLTLSFQSIKSALANPVKSLRSE